MTIKIAPRDWIAAVSMMLVVGGCASVSSRAQYPSVPTPQPTSDNALSDGLTYWMPRRDIVVSIELGGAAAAAADDGTSDTPKTPKPPKPPKAPKAPKAPKDGAGGDDGQANAAGTPAGGANPTPATATADNDAPTEPPVPESPVIKISASSAYADTTRAYVAWFRRNLIGKNQLTIAVNDRGLLGSAKSETTSELSQIFSAVATDVGSFAPMSNGSEQPGPCPKQVSLLYRVDPTPGDHEFVVPNGKNEDCKVLVKVTGPNVRVGPNARYYGTTRANSGFFYKQNLPYKVEVTYMRWKAEDVVLLPNDSPVQFLPVERSLFANNVSDLTFSDGVLTNYGQTVDGEALAVVKLPADILKAYFAAIGAMFTSRKDAATNEAAYLDAMLALTKKQLSTEICLAAYKSGDPDRIAKDCH